MDTDGGGRTAKGRAVWTLHKVKWVLGVETTHGLALLGAAGTPRCCLVIHNKGPQAVCDLARRHDLISVGSCLSGGLTAAAPGGASPTGEGEIQ